MGLVRRHRWFFAAAAITLAFAGVCLSTHQSSPALTAFSDLAGLALMLVGLAICGSNALSRPRQERSFWALMLLGFLLWTINQIAWTVWEVILRRPIPDPFFFDVILFFHTVPMIAAIAWRPDLVSKRGKILSSLLNFLMLFGWWIFLYAFIVFPHQYVVLDVRNYNIYYDGLYAVENALLVGVLILAALTSSGGWRRLYLHLLGASVLYGINSQFLDRAEAQSKYYSGSFYDVPLVGTLAWIVAAAVSTRHWELKSVEFNLDRRWKDLVPQLAMLAILSLPVLGMWSVLYDHSPAPSRYFRVYAVLLAMLLLGSFVFLRQYLQDQTLMSLLGESRHAYDSQMKLQSQLVQKEKLASLGNLIAGAAQEIDHPLNAVMSYSEQLWSKEKLTDEQNTLLRKIVNQARRTRDLVANLLSFARQAPGEKVVVDLSLLLNRAAQLMESRRQSGKIKFKISIDKDFPPVRGNANQLFQMCIEIIENAIDALEESGGVLEISAQRQDTDVLLQFSDSGPGIREPQRVFDPFYTTKPVGKGTGLGLSAVYGLVQDHGGQITCRNKPEGGAVFQVKIPALSQTSAQSAGAAG
ncbi:MAG TPA: HAMP domain-containing sensor histidine kinase [Candidatus Binatia bacterium]|nr:HAMP domain-containing sensor histidine kinase [Candidatus Binatia bacterium]